MLLTQMSLCLKLWALSYTSQIDYFQVYINKKTEKNKFCIMQIKYTLHIFTYYFANYTKITFTLKNVSPKQFKLTSF